MSRTIQIAVISTLVFFFSNRVVTARLFNNQSEISQSVFKNEGVDVIEFQIRLEKGAVSLVNAQLFSVSFDPKVYNVKDPESFYRAMTSWKERPFIIKNYDRDMVVHALKDSGELRPIVLHDDELKLLLMESKCRLISRIPPTPLSVPPKDYDKLYVVLTYDSTAIERFFEKCSRLKNVRTIELVRPAVNDLSP